MKLLIAVMTCHQLDYYVDGLTTDWLNTQGLRYLNVGERRAAQRATWLSRVPDGVDYKFFYGQQIRRLDIKPNQRPGTGGPAPLLRPALTDEIYLPCGDGYIFNAAKMKEICRYALNFGYDYILRVDDDTFVNLDRLLATDFTEYDYAGSPTGAFHPGSCMFLSRVAMERVVRARITSYADDLWVGQVTQTAGITRHDIDSIIHGFGSEYQIRFDRVKNTDFSALHSCTPDVMRKLWTLQMTLSSVQPKVTDGGVSKITPSVSLPPASVDGKFSSSVTLPTPPEKFSSDLDLNSLITPAPEITPSSSDSESFEIGSKSTLVTFDTLSTATSETL